MLMSRTALVVLSAAMLVSVSATYAAGTATDKKATAAPVKKAVEKNFKGDVVSTDVATVSVVVKVNGTDEKVTLDKTCKIMSGKKELKLGELAAGTKIAVFCKDEAGVVTVVHIEVQK